MSEQYNAKCDICGKPYKVCRSCQEIKSFQAWRTVTDTLPHYIIYLTLVEYSRTKDKSKAKEELLKCDLSEKDNFNDNIKSVINEIFEEELKTEDKSKTVIKKTNLPHTDKNIKVLNKKMILNSKFVKF